ncbi:MAG: succinate-semialdehyde dehydrogenase [Rhodocyclaceae bacterium]|nr:succinate-semialdehyde dehydrogenase [Rhodocyclaceae bacterium]
MATGACSATEHRGPAREDTNVQLQDSDLLQSACLVGGEWRGAAQGAQLSVRDPASGALLARVPDCGAADTRAAIAAAQAAFPAWSGKPARERALVLRRWYEGIVAAADDLALLMTSEQGKPLAEARAEVLYAASFVEWFAEEARRIYGDIIASPASDRRLYVLRQPIGVCAAITPWNFPAAMITRKVAPALAVGCTVVVKPAEQTPLTALALAKLAERAAFPPGVFNLLTGDPAAIGGELCASPVVRKLSFTGSTEIGRLLMRQCAPTIKKLSLELGGNAPFIVFDDADLDAAVDGALASKYRNSGQTCVCANRLFVQCGVYEEFASRLAARVAKMPVGPGRTPGVLLGPLIDAAALAKVEAHVADAVAQGAQVLTGGRRHALGGTFYEPTVLTGVTADMQCAREETFGPVAPLIRFTTEGDAIRMANDSEAGLAAYFYTRDLARSVRVAEALEYGIVGVNTGLISNEVAPFGGVKQSGLGREGSRYGADEYLEMKYVCLGGL